MSNQDGIQSSGWSERPPDAGTGPEDVDRDDAMLSIPDPAGPPVPVKRHPFQFTLRSMLLGVAACGGVFYVLSQNNFSTCAGATRSSRLKWQERQLEIEAAEQALQSDSAGSVDPIRDRTHGSCGSEPPHLD